MSSQLQNLSIQFNMLLNEYQYTAKKYTDLVNSNDNTFTQISNYSFFGSNLNVLNNSNVSACQTACSTNTACSGATFNKTSNSCSLISGPGNLVPNANSIAIIQQAIYYSNRLKELNFQMTALNQQMMDISSQNYNKYSHNIRKSDEKEIILLNNHDVLMEERREIDDMVRSFQTLDAAYQDGNIIVNANYSVYIIFLIFVVFLLFLLFKFAISSPQYGVGASNQGGNQGGKIIYTLVFAVIVVSCIFMQNNTII
jgi:hypothetical protein